MCLARRSNETGSGRRTAPGRLVGSGMDGFQHLRAIRQLKSDERIEGHETNPWAVAPCGVCQATQKVWNQRREALSTNQQDSLLLFRIRGSRREERAHTL